MFHLTVRCQVLEMLFALAVTLVAFCGPVAAQPENLSPAQSASMPAAARDTAPFINDFSKPFDAYSWVTAHNAYQDDIGPQLNRGVRGFMLDLYPGVSGSTVLPGAYMCHTNADHCIAKDSKRFSTELKDRFLPFLRNNPDAVVTLILENYVPAAKLQEAYREVPGIENFIFNPDLFEGDAWPTLQEMINKGQRLIILSSSAAGNFMLNGKKVYTLKNNKWAVENTYNLGRSVYKHDWSCVSRWDNIPLNERWIDGAGTDTSGWNRLFIMNQIHEWGSTLAHAADVDNNLTYLEERVEDWCKIRMPGTFRRPNYIAIDFNQGGDTFAYAAALSQGGIYFYEDNNANPNQDSVCVLPAGREYDLRLPSTGCENDEARSLALSGMKKGTRITVFDSPSGDTQDDYAIIDIKRDIRVDEKIVVRSFEQTYRHESYDIRFIRNNGLDGKVSRIEVQANAPDDFSDSKIAIYEARDGQQNLLCTIPLGSDDAFDAGKEYDCDNDDAVSAQLITARAGTRFTVYGDWNSWSCAQGCAMVEVLQDVTWPVIIPSFESNWTSVDQAVKVTRYGGRQQLNGKISSFRIERDRFMDRNVAPQSSEANGFWGGWGAMGICPDGKFVWGFRLKSEPDRGNNDDSALNAVEMYCSGDTSLPIRSKEGPWGSEIKGPMFCQDSDGPVTGFRIRIELPIDGDDSAAGNVRLICKNKKTLSLEPSAQWGEWSRDFFCPQGQAANGFVTRVEDPHDGDDSALNGLRLQCAPYTPPINPPTALRITGSDATSVDLAWTAATGGVGSLSYEIYGDDVVSQPATTTSGRITGLIPGQSYVFFVKARDAENNFSDPASGVPYTVPVPPLTPPGSLQVEPQDATSATLSWTAATGGVAPLIYDIYDEHGFKESSSATRHTLTQLTPGQTYIFFVQARDARGTLSPDSNKVTHLVALPLTPPTNLMLNIQGSTSVKLTWTAATGGIEPLTYEIHGDHGLIDTAATTNYTVTGLTHDQEYTFYIIARDARDTLSGESNRVQRASLPPPLTPPTDLHASAKITSVQLSWTLPPGLPHLMIPSVLINGQEPGEAGERGGSSYLVNGLTANTPYSFKVRISNSSTDEEQTSEPLAVSTLPIGSDITPPPAPTGVVAAGVSLFSIYVHWQPSIDEGGEPVTYLLRWHGFGEYESRTSATNATVGNLASGQCTTVSVQAVDVAGNESLKASGYACTQEW
jgi:hypothetical protein